MKSKKTIIKQLTLLLFLCEVVTFAHAQSNISLTFTGENQRNGYVKLSRVLVENIDQRWQEMLYFPDTMLHIGSTDISEFSSHKFTLFQNVPNPFEGTTEFSIYLQEESKLILEIYDLNGKTIASYSNVLGQGNHLFSANLTTPQTYLLSAKSDNGVARIKMINVGNDGNNSIEYLGTGHHILSCSENNSKESTLLPFNTFDLMQYKGYALVDDSYYESETVTKSQYKSEEIVLTFTLPVPNVGTQSATNISESSATLRGYVVSAEGYPSQIVGFDFADNSNMINALHYNLGGMTGSFQYDVSGLTPGTTYYVRAYATNNVGTAYGEQKSFTTLSLPTVTTHSVANVANTTATCGGIVTSTGGAGVTARGVCWSTSSNPTINNSYTTNGTGTGSFSSNLTGLTPGTTYYVRAYATNSVGTAYGEQKTFMTNSYCPPTVTDVDGNVYNTVQIGDQCWMRENLKTTKYANGTVITLGTDTSSTTAYRYYPNAISSNVSDYGYLYNWSAVMNGASSSSANPSGVQGICPDGWHVPSSAEWTQLTDYVSSQSQYVCGSDEDYIAKALASEEGWNSSTTTCAVGNNPSANNATGFSVRPAGIYNGGCGSFGDGAYFWSATQGNSNEAYIHYLYYNGASVYRIYDYEFRGYSVRCVRN